MSEAIAIRDYQAVEEHDKFMPAMSIGAAVVRRSMLVEFVQQAMTKDLDFGVIPGTNKPTLLKPGAEKLCTLFGLSARFLLADKIEDWHGKETGEPFFNYRYKCTLYRGDLLIAEGEGSCNSFEQKYRYRKAERTCPACGMATIIKGKEEYGGGWLCFQKKGGCGAKYRAGDQAIESQQVGRILNTDIYDQVNTLQKMSQKRSLIAATLIAVNASEFFTQDLEDLPSHYEAQDPKPEPKPSQAKNNPTEKTEQPKTASAISARVKRAKLMSAMGLVSRDEKGFIVKPPTANKEEFMVFRNEKGMVRCSCAEFEEQSKADVKFRCEHILAVKYHLEGPIATAEAKPEEAGAQSDPQEQTDTERDKILSEVIDVIEAIKDSDPSWVNTKNLDSMSAVELQEYFNSLHALWKNRKSAKKK